MSKSTANWVQSAVGPPFTLIWRHPYRHTDGKIMPVNDDPNFYNVYIGHTMSHGVVGSTSLQRDRFI